MTVSRILLLLRHCETEAARPGGRDADRRLTARGEGQAVAIGAYLRGGGFPVDRVLCSPATRTRQTADGLGLTTAVEIEPTLYDAGGDTILDLVRELDDDVQGALIVGHAPGVPAVVYDLSDPDTSEPAAQHHVADRFPSGTLAVLEITGSWADLVEVRLAAAVTP